MTGDPFPSGITDTELLTYIEGEATDELVKRIEQSKTLLQRVRRLEQETKWLTANLFRQACPNTDDLGDFHLGLLPEAQVRSIEQHLAHCPYCSRELVQYQDFLGDPPEQPSLAKRVVLSLARLLDETLLPQQMLSPAYSLRGEDSVTLYQANGLQISLDVQEDVEKPGHKSIVGVITGADAQAFTVDLWQDGEYLDTALIDETGGFTLSALLPGVYELIIKGADVIVHIQSFSL